MSGTDGTLRLIELASASLCNDINGLVGSLGHAVVAAINGSARTPELGKNALNTAGALTTRLELRQAAWGPDSEPVTLAHLRSLVCGLPEQVTVDASTLDHDTVFPAATGRIVLNLLLLAANSLPSGGTVILMGAPGDLFIRIAGPVAAWPPRMAICLSDESEARSELTEWRNPQMALTALLAHAAGIRLSVLISPTIQNEPAILRLGG